MSPLHRGQLLVLAARALALGPIFPGEVGGPDQRLMVVMLGYSPCLGCAENRGRGVGSVGGEV